MRVLVIEDTGRNASALAGLLRGRGHDPVCVALSLNSPHPPGDADVVVLDLDAPNKACLSTLRSLRSGSQVPTLVLAPRREEYPFARWLNGGADDYLVKPARADELLTRIESLGQRPWVREESPTQVVQIKRLAIDLGFRTVSVDGVPVGLTRTETDIVVALARRIGKPVSRQEVMFAVWGNSRPTSRALDTHMMRVREKLARPGLIRTLYGFGYQLGDT